MKTLRNFALAVGGALLAWLLWRVNGVIGDQALLLVFGIFWGVAVAAGIAVIAVCVWFAVRPERTQNAPQAPEYQPPVIVLLGDSQRTTQAQRSPAGLLADTANRVVGECDEWEQP